jgi:hypothetical protein
MPETWYDLPPQVQAPFEVYVNGVPQQADVDYRVVDRALVFPRALDPEVKMSRFQVVLATLGIAGTYNKHHTVDVTYQSAGRTQVVTGLRPRSPAA